MIGKDDFSSASPDGSASFKCSMREHLMQESGNNAAVQRKILVVVQCSLAFSDIFFDYAFPL